MISEKSHFIVIGSMKSGTSTLCHLLGQHPDVLMSTPKEPEFFCKDDIYDRGWNWYQALFAAAKNEFALGEGSSSYTKAPLFSGVPERIAKHVPQARLIYIVRHPLARIESHWMHRVKHGDTRSFKKMLREYPNLIDTSRYWFQIQQYRRFFSDDQILVLFFDDLKANPEAVLEECFRFLRVDPDVRLENPAEHRHVTGQFKVESDLLQRMKEGTAFRLIGRVLPVPLKNLLRSKLEIRVDARPEWSDALRSMASKEISDDLTTFLKFYNKPNDFWSLNTD